MAKEPEVTHEVTPHQNAGTTRPGFSTEVTDAPDYNRDNPNAATPSQRVQEEQAAGRAAIRDGGKAPGVVGGIVNPADADPARAAELAQEINAGLWPHGLPAGVRPPGDVPSRGMPPDGLIEGDELLQGTPDHRTQDPRLLDRDSELARQGEGRKKAQEVDNQRIEEVIKAEDEGRTTHGQRERNERELEDKKAQHERNKTKSK